MADLEPTADGARSLDPDEVSERSFPTAFRGFDPVQVRAFLGTVADELRRLLAVEAELRASMAAAPSDAASQVVAADDGETEAAPSPEPEVVVPQAADAIVEEARA